ncbi:hypothetical protein B0H14DRAFT_2607993 [Mycena olivaceomarginata]|nr:hypothetical protein B0H14DRAFT_2607993 [Mycena olivaceomarginata]
MVGFLVKLLKLKAYRPWFRMCDDENCYCTASRRWQQESETDRKLPGIISFPHSNLLRTTITGLTGVQVLSSPRGPRNARVVASLRHGKAAIAQGALTPSFSANPASYPTDTNYSNSQEPRAPHPGIRHPFGQWTLLTSARLPAMPRATVLPVPEINNHSGGPAGKAKATTFPDVAD